MWPPPGTIVHHRTPIKRGKREGSFSLVSFYHTIFFLGRCFVHFDSPQWRVGSIQSMFVLKISFFFLIGIFRIKSVNFQSWTRQFYLEVLVFRNFRLLYIDLWTASGFYHVFFSIFINECVKIVFTAVRFYLSIFATISVLPQFISFDYLSSVTRCI